MGVTMLTRKQQELLTFIDARLRADGVKVSVYRQTNKDGTWTDAAVDAETGQQLENKILERARLLKASELS
jgi:SOS-response transcriptional repressor LexA